MTSFKTLQWESVSSNYDEKSKLIEMINNFPGGTVAESPPANAGDMGSVPGPGRSHMLWSNRSPCVTATEARVP